MFKGVKNSLQDLEAETPTDPPTLQDFGSARQRRGGRQGSSKKEGSREHPTTLSLTVRCGAFGNSHARSCKHRGGGNLLLSSGYEHWCSFWFLLCGELVAALPSPKS